MPVANRLNAVAVPVCVLALGMGIGYFGTGSVGAAKPQQAPAPEIPKPAELSRTFATLAKRLQSSVVTITCTLQQRVSARSRRGNGAESPDDMLRRFFGGGDAGEASASSMGSGVIVDPNGYIITNQHVIDRATRIQVKLFDDPTDYEAKLIGVDRETDLAVIHVEASRKLSAAAIGNSDAVQVGEWAIAIGAPFGFETSVTSGIISAKGRDLGALDPDHPLPRFLQTDAAINEGNSGGPLLNIRGEVVGINTSLASEGVSSSGGYEGIGFAIPMNMVVKVYNDIIRTGRVTRGAIGVSFNPQAKPELLKAYGAAEGVFVEQVSPGGPADKAGIKVGDVITAFQGHPVKNGDELLGRVQDVPVGSTTELTVLRDGKSMKLKLEIADRAELSAARSPADSEPQPGAAAGELDTGAASVRFGISVRELTDELRTELNYSGRTGILVTTVEPASFAEDIGLREGDIITDLNRQPIRSIADLKRVQSSLKPGDAAAFRVLRNASQEGANWQAAFPAGTVPNR
jgi:serine protease Do